ncbi:MAG: SPOR domain-containing protein [Burkholderiaceae bacterium]
MKLAFLILVLANLAVFAWQQGAFGWLPESGREPGRIARQLEPGRIRVLTDKEVQQLRDKARQAPATAVAGAESPGAPACLEFGDFTQADAARVLARLAPLALGERIVSQSVELPGWYMVYVPPYKTRAEVERAAAELRKLGVKELLVIADNSPMRFGIALGSFKDQGLAMRHLEDLQRRGVTSARVADRPSTAPGTRLQIKGVDAALARELAAVQKEFPQSRLAPCQ